MIPKDLLFYIDVGLSAKKDHPDYPISDEAAIKMAVNMDYRLTYGKSWKEYQEGILEDLEECPKCKNKSISRTRSTWFLATGGGYYSTIIKYCPFCGLKLGG